MIRELEGRIWKLGDDIDTDIIIPTQYLALETVEEMKEYAFSPLRKGFARLFREGDIIVAGKNFGCGSSREQAPEIISALGVKCVVAQSFARIFFRNGINNGLLLIESPELYNQCVEGDTIRVKLNEHIIYDGKTFVIGKIPENLLTIIENGGLVKSLARKNKAAEVKA